jgi:hypothetical protein
MESTPDGRHSARTAEMDYFLKYIEKIFTLREQVKSSRSPPGADTVRRRFSRTSSRAQ